MADDTKLTRSGPRESIVAELRELAEGWPHMGRPDLGEAAASGAEAVAEGAAYADVGHTRYSVTKASDEIPPQR
ncbi:hypothetical protein OH723_24390 [Streptomyces albidoflavus]|uniref:hypothetical protein n=1 Tax=Streptomyces albidoflavus TaxID=1886 RepID=UPI00386DB84C|nr:hypothetical protein OH723_24390 [Streptomyces albidoflavus]